MASVPSRQLQRVLLVAFAGLALALACGPSAAQATPLFGFNDLSVAQGLATPEQDALLSRRAGADVARVQVSWLWAEQSPGSYDLARWDAIYAAMRSAGVRPLWMVAFAPKWAWASGIKCDPTRYACRYPPAPRYDSSWSAFVSLLATRYPDSAGIEVWNEPNSKLFWQSGADAKRYAQLLAEAHDAVKAVAPAMPVVTGGLANPVTGNGNIGRAAFLRALYYYGARSRMDGIGVHSYPGWSSASMLSTISEVRSVRDAAGDAGKPLWMTETGLSTTATDPALLFTEAQQATGLVNIYRGLSGLSDVAAVIVHTLVERPTWPASIETGYGVVRPDLTPKPAFCALAAARAVTTPCP